MSIVAASNNSARFSHLAGRALISQSDNGHLHVVTQFKTRQSCDTPLPANIRFQNSHRAASLTAFGLATLMTSTASAQEGGSSGLQLPTIDVTGDKGGGYQVTEPSLTRMPIPILNTPQSVNVVPQQVIQDQNATNVKDALRNVAGITFRAGEGGNQGDTPYIRGFSAQSDVFRDGVRDPGWYTRDDFATDRIEVYKGPSSFLFGRGSTGGVVNLVTKTPFDQNSNEATLTANTGPGVRATVDSNTVVNENVSARIITMGQLYDTPDRDHVKQDKWGFSPSVKMQLNDSTKLTLSYIYQHDNNIPDYGVPFTNPADGLPRSPAPVARNTWYGILSGPNPDVDRVDASVATAKIEHEINNQLKITNTTRYTDVLHYQLNVFPEPAANVPLLANLNSPWIPNRNSTAIHAKLLANQTDFTARFNTWKLEHTATFGFDAQIENRDFLRQAWTGQVPTNFLDPDPYRSGGTPLPPTANQLATGKSQAAGAYAADQIKLNRYFDLLGGLRYDYFRFEQLAPLGDPSVQDLASVNNVLSWRVGAVYHPIQDTSIYAMYGTSFNPSADNLTISVTTPATAISQFALPPEKNITTEFGAKADVLGGKLSLATAVFQIDKLNMRITDPTTSTTTVLGGVLRSRGFEASATGKLTDLWQVIATYSYIHARVISSTIPVQQWRRADQHADAQPFALVDLRSDAGPSGRRRRILCRAGLRRYSDGIDVAAAKQPGPGLLALRCHGGLQVRRQDHAAVQCLQSHQRFLLRVGLHQLGGARCRPYGGVDAEA